MYVHVHVVPACIYSLGGAWGKRCSFSPLLFICNAKVQLLTLVLVLKDHILTSLVQALYSNEDKRLKTGYIEFSIGKTAYLSGFSPNEKAQPLACSDLSILAIFQLFSPGEIIRKRRNRKDEM